MRPESSAPQPAPDSELFHRMAERAPVLLFVFQGDRNLYVNDAALRITGYGREELLAMNFWDIIHPEDQERIRRRGLARQKGEKIPSRYPVRIRTRDGRTRWLDYSGEVIEFRGRPAVLGSAFDITEQRRAQEALRESEERFRTLFDNASDYILMVDPAAPGGPVIVDANEAACTMHGYPRDELIGMPMRQIEPPETRDRIPDMARRLMAGEPLLFETVHMRKDGSTFPVEVSARRILINKKPYIYAIERDITQRKRIEAELARMEKLESLGVLAGGIAHDFNNILTAILGNISLAKLYAGEGGTISEMLSESEKAALRAKGLTQQLLTFSRGGRPLRKPLDLAPLIRECVVLSLRGSPVAHELSLPEDLRPVEADEGQISQVLHNLTLNALQAMPKGGTIRVEAENVPINEGDLPGLPPGPYVRIGVTDEGIGIPEEDLGRVFDPFFTTKQRGSGLGLSSCYSILKNHDGHIRVRSRLGHGSTFEIHLPASDRTPAKTEPKGIAAEPGRGRVLVMDDEKVVRDVAERMLHQMGYEVEAVRDGAEAVASYLRARAQGSPFDAVILDLTVPGGMGGKKTLEKLLEADPEIRAIVSSGYSNDTILADYRSHGFLGVMAKPFSIRDLREVLGQVLGPDRAEGSGA